jgi:hypothetical protein
VISQYGRKPMHARKPMRAADRLRNGAESPPGQKKAEHHN